MSRTTARSQPGAALGAATTAAIAPTALDHLREIMLEQLPLAPLDPVEYAAGHALFEARSDQRARLSDWLAGHVAGRAGAPSRVLSIGCGDGQVDVRVAAALAARGERVEYVGVEPHGPTGRAFAARLGRLPGVDVSVLAHPFAEAQPEGRFDLVLAVHSLYYVADLAATLGQAHALLAAGGELVVLHAPREPLNVLVRLLAPGRQQAFSDQVGARLRGLGLDPQLTRIDNRLDLGPTGDPDADARLLDFTVQARVTPALRIPVRAALAERALPGPGLVLSHPVDALVVPA